MGSPGALPPPTGDLDTREEIAEMVRRFYGSVAQDDLLGPIFNDVAKVDWSDHLPKLTDFWSRVLLGIRGYTGNPLGRHALIHQKQAFTTADFRRWLDLFTETIELGWTGPNAEQAVKLANNVARVHSQQLLGQPASGPEPSGPVPIELRTSR